MPRSAGRDAHSVRVHSSRALRISASGSTIAASSHQARELLEGKRPKLAAASGTYTVTVTVYASSEG